MATAEEQRLVEDVERAKNWKRWGPYLSERQWGTVREDYSATGECWTYLPHDHARSRAYRWGEDGLLGICDREARLCFGLALWNEHDPILKERLFGLTGPEGNHGEDVKECYYFLDATPTNSWLRALYKYPQRAYPYNDLVAENARRTRADAEYELTDTGVFNEDRYFDVTVEYAKAAPDDIYIRITAENRGPDAAPLHCLPSVWLRNTWSFGRPYDPAIPKPSISHISDARVRVQHGTLGDFICEALPSSNGTAPELLFTENESNAQRLWGVPNASPYVKDAFHERVVHGRVEAVNPAGSGTKAAFWYHMDVPAHGSVTFTLRLHSTTEPGALTPDVAEKVFAARRADADAFYAAMLPARADDEEHRVMRQAYAGLLWSKQFYYYVVQEWLEGDPATPPPPLERFTGRNSDWKHLYNRDVILMPDTWEYPWYAAWDLAFQTICIGRIDPHFAKEQLLLFLREWYMHPNGQLPAYEFAFGDVNPPVHAWACWRIYKMTGPRGHRDRNFLARAFHKLLLNFTWWVNRKDEEGNNLFSGGFLGLDNIGVFDRSQPLPTGGHLEQADGTAWMAFYCTTMLAMALELASEDHSYEDIASKFFEHFVAISDAMNEPRGGGLWDEQDGFYYDELHLDGSYVPLRVRSMVGLIPLFAVEVLSDDVLSKLPGFLKRTRWFIEHRPELSDRHTLFTAKDRNGNGAARLLAIPSRERLERVLRRVLDETEFLSPYGLRSLSRVHKNEPYVFDSGDREFRVAYEPGESRTGLFGGNSNWRGPIWFPLNYLVIESLERYHFFYGDALKVECPVGSGVWLNLQEVACELNERLTRLFMPDANGHRPAHGNDARYATDPAWRDLLLFYEYFDGDTGRGCGASHQTGWTALAARCMEDVVRARTHAPQRTSVELETIGTAPVTAEDIDRRSSPAAK